ncbi:MAG: SPFH domain-containing protein [Lachnospiraceae bacterium]
MFRKLINHILDIQRRKNMAKFIMECPSCGSHVEASTGIFAKKKIQCSCGNIINIKANLLMSKECPHCGNTVVYDRSKGDKALCPICHEKINTIESMMNKTEITCPSCSFRITVDKNAESVTCVLCETEIDVQNQIAKENAKNQGLASVIKYEGNNDVFVWKHPIEDFNLGTQLIVHESQEAIFFKDGKALDLFGSGRYTLSTQNLPILENLYKLPTNTDEVFHSEIYFINLTTQMGVKWGTDSRIRLFDPASGFYVEVGASGTFNIQVIDSRKLLLKLVGTTREFLQSDIVGGEKEEGKYAEIGKFKSLIVNNVKSNLARAIKEQNISILEIDLYLDILSEKLKDTINKTLSEYGLFLPEFFITTVVLPDEREDKNFAEYKKLFGIQTLKVRNQEVLKAEAEAEIGRKLVEAQGVAQVKLIEKESEKQLKIVEAQGDAETLKMKAEAEAEAYKMQSFAQAEGYRRQALAEAEEMKAKGYTYQQETTRQVGMEAMQNGITGNSVGGGTGNAGSILGDIASLGVTLGTVGGVVNLTKEALNPIITHASDIGSEFGNVIAGNTSQEKNGILSWNCNCGRTGIMSKFCPDCGSKRPEIRQTEEKQDEVWNCPRCGMKQITSKFCPECGERRGELHE